MFFNRWKDYVHYLKEAAGESMKSDNTKMIFNPRTYRNTYISIIHIADVDYKSASLFLGHAHVSSTLKSFAGLGLAKKANATILISDYMDGVFKGEW